jgi:hypothetical protein
MQKPSITLTGILFFMFATFSHAQQNDVEHITKSGNYIFGIGTGKSIPEADNAALHHLVTQISVEVESAFKDIITEEDGDLSSYTKRVVSTYSNTSLKQADMNLLPDAGGRKRVLRYMEKENMNKIFRERKQKALDYFMLGREAEKDLRTGDALKNYYWSLGLLRSHPDKNSITYDFEDYGERTLLPVLNETIEKLLSNIRLSVKNIFTNEEEKKKTVTLSVLHKGKPVSNLDYKYFTGNSLSPIVSAKDGTGVIELYDASAQSLRKVDVYIEYQYEHKWKIDDEVRRVMEDTKLLGYGKSQVKLNISDPETLKDRQKHYKDIALDDQDIFDKTATLEDRDKFINRTFNVVEGIQQQQTGKLKSMFTRDGYKMFDKLINQGRVKVLFDDTASLSLVEVNKQFVVRSVPMMFNYENNNRKFVEDVVFVFDDEGKIDAVNFALSEVAVRDILDKNDEWGTPQEKYTLIQFLEYYKTAYSLKRLDYLEQVFDDNALIIVGHVLKKEKEKSLDGLTTDLNQKQVEYVKLSKEKYIQRLSNVFRSNEYINIDFEDNQVRRHQNEKIFGIQINQHYYSSNYGDQGYLFLMVDLQDILNPRIYVRSWQPEKFEDGSIIGLKNFHF